MSEQPTGQALEGAALATRHRALGPSWKMVRDGHHLIKQFEFPDFVTALAYVNAVGEMSEDHGHHPVIVLTWGEVTLKIWTHSVDGLTEKDFTWAAAADRLYRPSGGDGKDDDSEDTP